MLFMKNLAPIRSQCFFKPAPYCHQPVGKKKRAKLLRIQYKNILEVLTVVPFMPTLLIMKILVKYHQFQSDIYENSNHFEVSKDFFGKLCMFVSFGITFIVAFFLIVHQL